MSKNLSSGLMTLLFVLLFVVTPVSAASNQGLHWGITVGSRFDYHEYTNFTIQDSPEERDFYVIIDSLPSIPDDINATSDLPNSPSATHFHENGTQIEGPSTWSALPVGNWSVIIGIWEGWWSNQPELNVTQDIINTPHLIGYNYTVLSRSGLDTCAEIYVRTTGVLHTLYLRSTWTDGGLIFLRSISLVEGVTWPFPFDAPLGVASMAIGGIAVILILLVVLRKE
ncbi:MAG: hypothetical protein ACFFEU_13545 [Candidatus Thorarchaeota archaeon]